MKELVSVSNYNWNASAGKSEGSSYLGNIYFQKLMDSAESSQIFIVKKDLKKWN